MKQTAFERYYQAVISHKVGSVSLSEITGLSQTWLKNEVTECFAASIHPEMAAVIILSKLAPT